MQVVGQKTLFSAKTMLLSELIDLLSVQVNFTGDNDEEVIEQCVNASLIVDVFGNSFDGEQLLEGLYGLGIDLDDYADIIESNLSLIGLYQQ